MQNRLGASQHAINMYSRILAGLHSLPASPRLPRVFRLRSDHRITSHEPDIAGGRRTITLSAPAAFTLQHTPGTSAGSRRETAESCGRVR